MGTKFHIESGAVWGVRAESGRPNFGLEQLVVMVASYATISKASQSSEYSPTFRNLHFLLQVLRLKHGALGTSLEQEAFHREKQKFQDSFQSGHPKLLELVLSEDIDAAEKEKYILGLVLAITLATIESESRVKQELRGFSSFVAGVANFFGQSGEEVQVIDKIRGSVEGPTGLNSITKLVRKFQVVYANEKYYGKATRRALETSLGDSPSFHESLSDAMQLLSSRTKTPSMDVTLPKVHNAPSTRAGSSRAGSVGSASDRSGDRSSNASSAGFSKLLMTVVRAIHARINGSNETLSQILTQCLAKEQLVGLLKRHCPNYKFITILELELQKELEDSDRQQLYSFLCDFWSMGVAEDQENIGQGQQQTENQEALLSRFMAYWLESKRPLKAVTGCSEPDKQLDQTVKTFLYAVVVANPYRVFPTLITDEGLRDKIVQSLQLQKKPAAAASPRGAGQPTLLQSRGEAGGLSPVRESASPMEPQRSPLAAMASA